VTRDDGTFAVVQSIFPLSNGPKDKGDYPAEWGFDFTGAYTVLGPTETLNGRFAIRRTIYLHNQNAVWNLDSTAYPARLALKGRQLMQWTSQHAERIVEATVDGVSLVVYSGGEHWDFTDPIALQPESCARVSASKTSEISKSSATTLTMPAGSPATSSRPTELSDYPSVARRFAKWVYRKLDHSFIAQVAAFIVCGAIGSLALHFLGFSFSDFQFHPHAAAPMTNTATRQSVNPPANSADAHVPTTTAP
jgi:hypothetical protein